MLLFKIITQKKRSLSHFIFSSFAYKAAAFCGCSSSTGEAVRRGSCSSGFIGNKWHCAYCAINWSTRTKATIASTIGTAATKPKKPSSIYWVRGQRKINSIVSGLYSNLVEQHRDHDVHAQSSLFLAYLWSQCSAFSAQWKEKASVLNN